MILGKPIEYLIGLNKAELFNYFCQYSSYIFDAPAKGPYYVIRVGSHFLYDNDTALLYAKFQKAVAEHRRKKKVTNGGVA